MSTEGNKTIVREFYRIMETGDLSTADRTVSANYEYHGALSGPTGGLEGFKQGVTMIQSAFSDLRFTFEDQIAEGDRVSSRYTAQGTHRGEFLGVAATGKRVSWTAHAIQRVVDGKVQDSWLEWDTLALMRQLGVVPTSGS